MARTTIYLPDELAEQVKDSGINVSSVCQAALNKEIEHMRTLTRLDEELEEITVELSDDDSTWKATFTGIWLVLPIEENRSEDPDFDAGAYWGVARTGRGRIAVLVQHVNEGFHPVLDDYDNLAAAEEDLPSNIYRAAASALGQTVNVRLDI